MHGETKFTNKIISRSSDMLAYRLNSTKITL